MRKIIQQEIKITDRTVFSKIQYSSYLLDKLKDKEILTAICEWFHYAKLQTHDKLPSVRNMSLERGIKTLTEIIRIDAQTPEDIILVLNESFTNQFWRNNLLTVGQLRAKCSDGITKYEKLLIAIQKEKSNVNTGSPVGKLELL